MSSSFELDGSTDSRVDPVVGPLVKPNEFNLLGFEMGI